MVAHPKKSHSLRYEADAGYTGRDSAERANFLIRRWSLSGSFQAHARERITPSTMPMKVILLQEVAGLGKPGDVKSVADGFARNYLLPRQMVEAASPGALATLQTRVATEIRRQEKLRAELSTLTERLNNVRLTFTVRVGGQNRLYGSVTNQNIADALRETQGIIVDRRAIQLRDALRNLGEYKVPVRLGQGFDPKITVEVTAENV